MSLGSKQGNVCHPGSVSVSESMPGALGLGFSRFPGSHIVLRIFGRSCVGRVVRKKKLLLHTLYNFLALVWVINLMPTGLWFTYCTPMLTDQKLKLKEGVWVLSCFSCVQLFATLRTVACRLFCPWDPPGKNTGVGCHSLLQGNLPDPGMEPASLMSPALLGGVITTNTTWEALKETNSV